MPFRTLECKLKLSLRGTVRIFVLNFALILKQRKKLTKQKLMGTYTSVPQVKPSAKVRGTETIVISKF